VGGELRVTQTCSEVYPSKRATWDIDHVYHVGESMLLKKIWTSSEPTEVHDPTFGDAQGLYGACILLMNEYN
jgi:hypothetical protein